MNRTGTLPTLLCALALVLWWPVSEAATASRDLQVQEQKRERLREEIARLQKNIEQGAKTRNALDAELREMDLSISSANRKLRQLRLQTRQLQQELAQLQVKQRQGQEHLAQTRKKLAQLLRSAYISGQQQRLILLLNQRDPQSVSRLMTYHDYLSRQRVQQLAELDRAVQEMQKLAAAIEQRKVLAAQVYDREAAGKQALLKKKEARKALLKRVEARLHEQRNQLARRQEDEQRLARLISGIQTALQTLDLPEQNDFSARKGQLPWPLRGRLAIHFGSRKIGSLRWDGVLIGAPEGRPVAAVHAGRVAYADWLRGYGLLAIIDHGQGYMTLYGNIQSLFRETGDWVEAGEVIGQAGHSGESTQAGLYFGIRHKGKALNPVKWCRKKHGKRVG